MSRRLILYHWTRAESAEKILRNGFMKGTGEGLTHGPGVYLSDGPLSYARPHLNALLEVEVWPQEPHPGAIFAPDAPAVSDTSELWFNVRDLIDIRDVRNVDRVAGVTTAQGAPYMLPYLRARQLRASGQSKEALRILLSAVEKHPSDTLSRFELAMLLDKAGRIQEALAHYQRVVNEKPDWAEALHSLGWMHGMKIGNYEDGIKHLRRATELEPENPSRWYALACIYQAAEQFEEAKVAFQECKAKKPEEYICRNVELHLKTLSRRLRGDTKPVYPRR